MSAPAKKFRVGYVTATIWKKTNDGRDYYSVEVSRTFKEGDELKNTSSLNHADILVAADLLVRANDWIMAQ
jgi:hypothetical protein